MGLLANLIGQVSGVEKHERLKVFFLTISFFLIIGAYTLAKELKDSIFMSIVGREYIPWASIPAMIILVPAILFYSKLVDSMRRYKLLSCYCIFFGVMGLIFAYYIGHARIGLHNTDTGPDRLFGWLFYCFVEGYSPFVVSVFWAFVNSINNPESAKKYYGLMVSGSKLGGMFTAGLAWYLFSQSSVYTFSDVVGHQIILIFSSLLLLLVPLIIYLLMRKVPGKYLHGYEAVYQVEKQRKRNKIEKTGMLAGIKLLLKQPYVFGIFGMVYFFEVIAKVLSYLRLGVAQSNAVTISDISAFLFKIRFITHLIGLFISIIGTGALLRFFGERICLLFIPLISGVVLLYMMIETTPTALMIAYVVLQSVNYAFSWPVRESLYIPTVKEIKFKSKSWVDAFGSKFAKASGNMFNVITNYMGTTLLLPVHAFFFAGTVALWFIVAFLLGKRFDRAIATNEVIGLEKKLEDELLSKEGEVS